MAKPPEKKTVYRDSKDGQFITKREADRRRAAAEKEQAAVVKAGGKKK